MISRFGSITAQIENQYGPNSNGAIRCGSSHGMNDADQRAEHRRAAGEQREQIAAARTARTKTATAPRRLPPTFRWS